MNVGSGAQAEAAESGPEQRTQRRKRVFWPGLLETGKGGLECRVANMSPGGAKVRVPEAVGRGEPVSLIVPELGLFHGVVAWEREGAVGIKFTNDDLSEGRNSVAASQRHVPDTLDLELSPAAAATALRASGKVIFLAETQSELRKRPALPPGSPPVPTAVGYGLEGHIKAAMKEILPDVIERIDLKTAAQATRDELKPELVRLVAAIAQRKALLLNKEEQAEVSEALLHDMLGLGPLEPLLADDAITDILVNGANAVYIERGGKLELTDVRFIDDRHVLDVALRVVTRVGRRIDASVPLNDARLADGSRVNVIVPPLALKGPMISIRKFSKKEITLARMVAHENLSPAMAMLLKIAARCRVNVLISGGTGSGKTTLLNAVSQMIDPTERVITIEDAAELQLQLPHVGSLETRPPNLEGKGEINMRDLFRNALRMRPDRIILGEIRGEEAFDMLQAMNSGHDGSLGTIHASGPREALGRMESIIAMSAIEMPSRIVRSQIATAIDLVVQVSRMRDGKRRVTNIVEVSGIEAEEFATRELFRYHIDGEQDPAGGGALGKFECSGGRPNFMAKAEYAGLGRQLMAVMTAPESFTGTDLEMD